MVVAIGGNALLRQGEHGTDQEQARNAEAAARVIADLVRRRMDVVVVHGNGPQVGNLLIQMEKAALEIPPSSLDVAVAMSQGSIGYLLGRSLQAQLDRRGLRREVVTLVTSVVVADEPSGRPTKPVGPFFSRYRARDLMKRSGWKMVEDSGRGWRKVVPSPRPVEIVNLAPIQQLLQAGHVVIAAGGGGIPVKRGKQGRLVGVEAVIDKDHTAALLGAGVHASLLLCLTSISEVQLGFASEKPRPLAIASASELRAHLAAGEFAEGSMAPKVEAVLSFLAAGGREAIITDAATLKRALAGRGGTRVYRDTLG